MKLKLDKPTRRQMIKKLDAVFSDYIRWRDGWKCQRCQHQHEVGSKGLACSHFWHRGDMGTRHHEDNCVALCYACHQRWEGDKQGEYMEFMLDKLGEQKYNILKAWAKGTIKFTVSELQVMLQVIERKLAEAKSEACRVS